MRLDEPYWWYNSQEQNLLPKLLEPFGQLYGWAVTRRFATTQAYKSQRPVICVGNLTAGGTGKTPLAMFIANRLLNKSQRPVFLTRGYKGRSKGPLTVEPERHTSIDVGDEPLLLATTAPTIVAKDRSAGARFIEQNHRQATHIIMDDGLQNPTLSKDLTIAVIDANRGVGNGRIIPAGPLRAPLAFQLNLADAVLLNGLSNNKEEKTRSAIQSDQQDHSQAHTLLQKFRREFPGPVLTAAVEPVGDTNWINGTRFIAYAGIANPNRFYELLRSLGADLSACQSFPDHHDYTAAEIHTLLNMASEKEATLITTKKDIARLSKTLEPQASLRAQSRTLEVAFSLKNRNLERLESLIAALPTGNDNNFKP